MKNVRKIINEIMNEVLGNNATLSSCIDKKLNSSQLNDQDIALVKQEVYGTMRNLIKINYIIYKYNQIKKVDIEVLNILRTSCYEIIFLDKIPEHATCNEAVNLVKIIKKKSATKFVNAVLRNIIRVKNVIEYPKKEDGNIVEYLSVNFSMPEWICETFLDSGYDVSELEKMFDKMNKPSDITLLTNTKCVTRDELEALLRTRGLKFFDGNYIHNSFRVKSMPSIAKMKEYKNGYFYVQDESSMIAGMVLDAKVGEKILDVCASPGGKSIYTAISTNDEVDILCCDVSKEKVKYITQNKKRLKLASIKTKVRDATIYDVSENEKYDKLILDVPCSGLGLLGKKPDIRYNLSPVKVESLVEIQRKIFDTAIRYLKVGGELIYTTCTLNSIENEKNLEYFLNNKAYRLEMVSIDDKLPKGIKESAKGYVKLLPHVHDTDGFFISKMRKLEG